MESKKRIGSKHPSLPHIVTTGLVLIALELHWSWGLSTPRERQVLAVALAGEQRAAMVGVLSMVRLCGLGAGQEVVR